MSFDFAFELTQAEEYIDKGQFYEALQVLNNPQIQNDALTQREPEYNYLKSVCLSMLGQDEEALDLAEKVYQSYEKFDNISGMLRSSILIAEVLAWLGKQEKALEIILRSEKLLEKTTREPNFQESTQASIYCIKAMVCSRKGNLNNASAYIKNSLKIGEQYSNLQNMTKILYNYGYILLRRSKLIKSLKNCEQALSLAKDGFNRYISRIYIIIGVIKFYQGDLEKSINYTEQGLKIATKMNCKRDMAGCLNNIGETYHARGNLKQAQIFYKQSLQILKELDAVSVIAIVLASLFQGSLDLGDFKKAEYYLNSIKAINKREENEETYGLYLLCKASLLKSSSHVRNIAKSEEILKQIINNKLIGYETRKEAILQLCDLYIIDLKNTNNIDLLEEIQIYISQLYFLAKKTYSYPLLAEIYLIQAKLALLRLEFKEARELLTEGQKIAEKYELTFLAIKISNEHDELLKELGKWEYYKEIKASIEKRIRLSHLNEQMNFMLKKRIKEPEEIINEIPVAIFILSEGGVLIFSQSFEEGFSFEDHLLGGFITAISAFSDEIFSKGLDRASFGHYTILIKSISPFLIGYLFKGKTFPAQQKMNLFSESFVNEKLIWQTFCEFSESNLTIKLNDIPSLKDLIEEVFTHATV